MIIQTAICALVTGVRAWGGFKSQRLAGLERVLWARRGKCGEGTSHTFREPPSFSNPGRAVSKQKQQNSEREIRSGNGGHWWNFQWWKRWALVDFRRWVGLCSDWFLFWDFMGSLQPFLWHLPCFYNQFLCSAESKSYLQP